MLFNQVALVAVLATCASSLSIFSPAFENNGMMPRAHECTSSPNPDPAQLNESPPFNWTSAPAETKSFAIIMTDISINLLHWIIYDIPPNVLSLPQKVENKYQPAVPLGSRQIYYRGSAQLWGYQGPCSPNSVNSYEFVVYALNKANLTELNENSTIRAGATAIRAASIGSAKTVGKS